MGSKPSDQALARRPVKPYQWVKDFQEGSHFTLGCDFRPQSTRYQFDYHAHWGDFRRQPAPPPIPSDVLNKEKLHAWQPWSETRAEYQGKPLDCRAPIYPTPMGGMIPVDPREKRPAPVTKTTYHWHDNIQPPQKMVSKKWQTQIILGDDGDTLPRTNYQDSYPDYHRVLDMRNDSTQMDGQLPPLPCKESKSIIEGEPQCTPPLTFTPKPPESPRSDIAKRRRQRAKATVEEEEEWLKTTTAADFQWKTSERRKLITRQEVVPSLLYRDTEGKQQVTNTTTYHLHFGKPINKDMRRTLSHPQKEEPLCVTIPGQPVSGSTAYKEHFQPTPAGYQKADPVQLDLYKTHFELSLPGAGPATTITQDLYAGRKLENSK